MNCNLGKYTITIVLLIYLGVLLGEIANIRVIRAVVNIKNIVTRSL